MSYRQSVHWNKPLVVLAISALLLCISQKTGAGADTVRVAYSSPTATQGILWVADVGGLFKRNGLDYRLSTRGWPSSRWWPVRLTSDK